MVKLYICLDGEDIHDVAEDFLAAVEDWIGQQKRTFELINQQDTDAVETSRFGLAMTVKKTSDLTLPLDFLYRLAKQFKQEFVLSIWDSGTEQTEDICYFGHEEGKPDIYEIASYIDL